MNFDWYTIHLPIVMALPSWGDIVDPSSPASRCSCYSSWIFAWSSIVILLVASIVPCIQILLHYHYVVTVDCWQYHWVSPLNYYSFRNISMTLYSYIGMIKWSATTITTVPVGTSTVSFTVDCRCNNNIITIISFCIARYVHYHLFFSVT